MTAHNVTVMNTAFTNAECINEYGFDKNYSDTLDDAALAFLEQYKKDHPEEYPPEPVPPPTPERDISKCLTHCHYGERGFGNHHIHYII